MKARGGALREIREMFAPYCFHKKDTIPIHKLESGDYGYSNVSKYTLTNRNIVLKQIYFNDMEQERLSRLCSEYILLMRATNRYLNPPIGFIFNNPIIIATDQIPNGNLYTAIKENRLDPTDKTKIAMGVAYAMRRLHKMHLVHGDLKSKNVLLGDDFRPLVTDFAFGSIAHNLSAPIQYRITDPCWCAPEVLRGQPPTTKSDVYSFGTLISELYNGAVHYRGAAIFAHVDEDLLPTSAPRMMQALVKVCTNPDPQKRPDFRRIYRLFKNCVCFFEGTDLNEVRAEVQLIKADLHKSHLRFHPLSNTKLPTRQEIQELITKNGALNQQRRFQRNLIKSRMTIGVREARGIQLNCRKTKSAPSPSESSQNNANKLENHGSADDKLNNGKESNLTISPHLTTFSNFTPKKDGSCDYLRCSDSTSRSAEFSLSSNSHGLSLGNLSLGKGMNLLDSKPSSSDTSLSGAKNLGLSTNIRLGSPITTPRHGGSQSTRVPVPPITSPSGPININTSYKGRISAADRFKTVDDVDGRNYLRLPRRMRKQSRPSPNMDIPLPKERLYRSSSPLRSYRKEEKKKMTKSLLCLAALIKQGKISMGTLRKQEGTAVVPLSKQMMPYIRPQKSNHV